jgi:hypothetical protein
MKPTVDPWATRLPRSHWTRAMADTDDDDEESDHQQAMID